MGSSDEARAARRTTARRATARRALRDWLVDVCCISLAAVFSMVTCESVANDPPMSDEALFADVVAGALGCLALWLRRRRPVELAVVLLGAGLVSYYVAGPLLVALFTVAVHRPLRTVALVGAAAAAQILTTPLVHPDPDLDYVGDVLLGALLVSGAIGWGMFVRSRRQLLVSLRERAARAEAEAALRAERTQRLTRERIAREMHDVLAHRLSLLSVHAGALEYRADASPQEVAEAAGVIRSSAHQALQDLREVIGVLRAPESDPDGGPPDRPQPTLADLPRLVEESRRAGMRVTLSDEAGVTRPGPGTAPDTGPGTGIGAEAAAVPGATGRTAYRIVQEGLTNARKHAPDTEVTVTAAGAPGEGLTVEVCNAVRAPARARTSGSPPGRKEGPAAIPGAGQGLTGLAERAALAGGRLECGPSPAGDFRLYAWLPWPA
ncbi:sensor histidine kinase [Streptomyces sparsogenes]|uniref:histidine kinase n=1 Tax=Streptomyces sparsogenes DSM 40356 TaxID=1331668 RepID=A0A1R1SRN3_9ACTN|nr:histidine kinase [Streptomyces sparsogenes]OMI40980.1 two-component system sensor kinase [Streptomyces sparsogenes DSM 40356]